MDLILMSLMLIKIAHDPGGKWSLISGPFSVKLSIGLLSLAEITNENLYTKSTINLCN